MLINIKNVNFFILGFILSSDTTPYDTYYLNGISSDFAYDDKLIHEYLSNDFKHISFKLQKISFNNKCY